MGKGVSGSLANLAGTRAGIIFTSAFFWAWFDISAFRQALIIPFGQSYSFLDISFIVTMSGGSLSLFLAMIQSRSFSKILARHYSGAIFCCCGILGNILAFFGALLSAEWLLLLGSFTAGAACQLIFLRWMSIYSYKGAKSAGICVSGAIALGAGIDVLILSLPPVLSACLTILLVVPSLVVFLHTDAEIESISSERDQAPLSEKNDLYQNSEGHLSLSSIFYNSKQLIFGLPFSLIIAFFIFGFSFGFMQCDIVFASASLPENAPLILLIARGVTASVIFLATICFPRQVYKVYKIGVLVGIAGFVAIPFSSVVEGMNIIPGFVIAVGYATFDIITITLLAEISFVTGESSTRFFSSGRFVIHTSLIVGFLFTQTGLSILFPESFLPLASSAIGYFLVIASMLLLNDSSALWMLIRYGRISGIRSRLTVTTNRQAYDCLSLASQHDLTDRESEVLDLLLTGRSAARIAQMLSISEHTVNSHVQHIYRKFGVHNRQSLLDFFDGKES